MSTLTEAPTVTLREVARAIGAAPLAADLLSLAAAVGVPFTIVTDWQGRTAVTAAEARGLVDAMKARHAARMAAKAAAQVTEAATRASEDAEIQAAAQRAYDVSYLSALLLNAKNPALIAHEAASRVANARDVTLAPTVEDADQARRRLIDGGVYPAPEHRPRW